MTPSFLKLTNKQGVNIAPGDADWQGYEGWIKVERYALEPPRRVSSAEGAGRLKTGAISVYKTWDSASVSLDRMYKRGESFSGILDVVNMGKREVYRFSLSNAKIAEMELFQSGRKDDGVTEGMTITCDPIKMPQTLRR